MSSPRPPLATLTIRIPPDLRKRAEREAARRGLYVSELIREAIEAILAPPATR